MVDRIISSHHLGEVVTGMVLRFYDRSPIKDENTKVFE